MWHEDSVSVATYSVTIIDLVFRRLDILVDWYWYMYNNVIVLVHVNSCNGQTKHTSKQRVIFFVCTYMSVEALFPQAYFPGFYCLQYESGRTAFHTASDKSLGR